MPAAPSVLANMGKVRQARMKAAAQLGLTPLPLVPPQAGRQIRGAVPPPVVPKEPTSDEALFDMTKKFLESIFAGMPTREAAARGGFGKVDIYGERAAGARRPTVTGR